MSAMQQTGFSGLATSVITVGSGSTGSRGGVVTSAMVDDQLPVSTTIVENTGESIVLAVSSNLSSEGSPNHSEGGSPNHPSPTFTPLTRMAEMPPDGEDGGWSRPQSSTPINTSVITGYYDHPLTAATTAMLNINGDEQSGPVVYEYYKVLQSPNSHEKGDKTLIDIWTTSASSPTVGGALITSSSKLSNGISVELGESVALSQAHADLGLFMPSAHVKREPEDLTQPPLRKSALISVPVVIDGTNRDKQSSPRTVLAKVLLNGEGVIKRESDDDSPPPHTPTPVGEELLVVEKMSSSVQPYPTQLFANLQTVSAQGSFGSESLAQYMPPSVSQGNYVGGMSTIRAPNGPIYSASTPDSYYSREFYSSTSEAAQYRHHELSYSEGQNGSALVDRYRSALTYKPPVDLPSPDSGIGAETPREPPLQPSFEYSTDLCQPINDAALGTTDRHSTGSSNGSTSGASKRPWHDAFGRPNDVDKIQIPKIISNYGFKYHLESPISTSQRREDDRITYVNKGQFYAISLEYIQDPETPLKSQTVKSVVSLMFREEKSPEDEIKAWQFWHGRQHSAKQRILDADTKNSVGIIGGIEELAHNAIAFYWNPLETVAKINVAVQCLSTDFSTQKGVKGLPLHLQIDTYEDPRDTGTPSHRGYCQIKVFCDKGAERKTRDEERRAAKRRMSATGRRKLDELYHSTCDRSEFYAMRDLDKPPVLFTPATEEMDKYSVFSPQFPSMDIPGFSHVDPESSNVSAEDVGTSGGHLTLSTKNSPFVLPPAKSPVTTLKFHNNFPPDNLCEKKELTSVDVSGLGNDVMYVPSTKRMKISPPPVQERMMIYVKQDSDKHFTPLHLIPPTTMGLRSAIESAYKISTTRIRNVYRQNRRGITARIDDDMLKHYCNEDSFIIELQPVEDDEMYDLTLIELGD